MKQTLILISLAAIVLIPSAIFSDTDDHEDHDMISTVDFQPRTLEEMERFHGHLGPFIVLGVKMAEHAHTAHGIPVFFGLTVKAETPKLPPPSCLIDGIQLGIGATMGKGNLERIVADEIKVTFIDNESGNSVVYRLKDTTKALIKKWAEANEPSLHERGEHFFHMKAEALFEIQLQQE
ncbi:MAG: hypothetical protein C4527_12870 [Candidatus Omnitrophota bacterium]|jgi:formylmethanofuran dehydrogenase subunit E|nr:MAG: hypothetical protein C4527_12870 [Candidatus Omnitrophota bacterium]